MFKKFRNGAYDCIVTDNLFCFISDRNQSPNDPEFYFSHELKSLFPSIKYLISFNHNEFFDISFDSHKRVTKEDIHNYLRISKFNDSFESKLED